jgi:hypothetical protein
MEKDRLILSFLSVPQHPQRLKRVFVVLGVHWTDMNDCGLLLPRFGFFQGEKGPPENTVDH